MKEMDYKQVIAVRKDLKMSSGKTAAQAAHAAHSAAEKAREGWKEWYTPWRQEGQKKVVVSVANEKEIIDLYEQAREKNLPCYIVNDAGLTELSPGTVTTVGIGPAPNEVIDRVTGHLKLF